MWSEERIALAKKRWSEGCSATAIAAELKGVTRSAVLGKLWRLGYRGDRPRRSAVNSHRIKAERQKRRATINFIPNKVIKPSKAEKLRDELEEIRNLPALGPLVSDARYGVCRYVPNDPAIDAHCCGRATFDGRPWCAQHARLVYVPSKPKAKTRSVESDERRRWLRQIQQEMAA